MMSGISDYLSRQFMDYIQPFKPPRVEMSLHHDDGYGSPGEEVSGSGYKRVQVSASEPAKDGAITLDNITFPPATERWGEVSGFKLINMDNGVELFSGGFQEKAIYAGDTFQIEVDVDLDPGVDLQADTMYVALFDGVTEPVKARVLEYFCPYCSTPQSIEHVVCERCGGPRHMLIQDMVNGGDV